MTSFAKIENNMVTQVIVAELNFIQSGLVGDPNSWIQTSTTNPKRRCVLGSVYDSDLDCFIPPKVFESWIFNSNDCTWEPPIPKPNDDQEYDWNEDLQKWIINEGKILLNYPENDVKQLIKLVGDTIASE